MDFQAELTSVHDTAVSAIGDVASAAELEEARVRLLGRSSPLGDLGARLKALDATERPQAGKRLNEVRQTITTLLADKKAALATVTTPLDTTAPPQVPPHGRIHVYTQTVADIAAIFDRLGLRRLAAPDADYDWYVFEALNMGHDHPARDEWETFFLDVPADATLGQAVLRPHTTNLDLHALQTLAPPFGVYTIGTTFRRQADASHTPMFHQFEGMVVGNELTIGNLIATLEFFVHEFFGPDVRTRLRPYHFPFTEPSFEVDISCTVCGGTGCALCKDGWLELGGAGMTHPKVLAFGGLDPEQWRGYAWGWGVERCLAIRHGVTDLRQIYRPDRHFVETLAC